MCNAGWYDWFCNDEALLGRLKKIVPKVRKIAKSQKIDQDMMCVWFKNNCPAHGNLYDDFRISYLPPYAKEISDYNLFVIRMANGYFIDKNYGQPEVYTPYDEYNAAVAVGWAEIYRWFGVNQKPKQVKPVKKFNRFAVIDIVV